MTYLSILEKFKILFDMLLDFEFILVFVILLMLFTFLHIIKKINIKKYVIMVLISFIVVFGISIIGNYDVLSNTFDNFTTIFFGNIYFPSIYVYIFVLVISFITFIVSILNVMIKKIYKVINSIMFIINNILFIIILNIIAKNKIDVFSVNSLYTNTNLVAVLELSMGLFILWVLSLIVVYITNVVCDRIANKKVIKNEVKDEVFSPVLEVNNELVCDTINNDYDVLMKVEVISNNDSEVVIENIEDTFENNVVVEEIEKISNNDSEIVIENIEDTFENNVVVEEIENISNNDSEVVIENIEDTFENNVVVEEIENISNNNNSITFNDILNGCVPVTYYDNNVSASEYELVNPQMLYENKYDKLLNNSVVVEEIFDNNVNDVELSIEEKTILEKEKLSEERLLINTISLNDLIHEDDNIIDEIKFVNNINEEVHELVENNNSNYTIDDYKKFIKMLNDIKNYSREVNISIDDAMAISLISNYSIDDCMMFKKILENNLN